MATILPFPTQAREPAPRHFARATALIDAGETAQSAALDLIADGRQLLFGDRPTIADNTMNGQAMASLVDALATLILANGAQPAERDLLAAAERWRAQNRS